MDIVLQIDRLENINGEIEAAIRLDKLNEIQPLIDERESRISKLIAIQNSVQENVFSDYSQRLKSIQEGSENLSQLIELKLKVLRSDMRKVGDAQTISKGYLKGTNLLATENRRTTDITG